MRVIPKGSLKNRNSVARSSLMALCARLLHEETTLYFWIINIFSTSLHSVSYAFQVIRSTAEPYSFISSCLSLSLDLCFRATKQWSVSTKFSDVSAWTEHPILNRDTTCCSVAMVVSGPQANKLTPPLRIASTVEAETSNNKSNNNEAGKIHWPLKNNIKWMNWYRNR